LILREKLFEREAGLNTYAEFTILCKFTCTTAGNANDNNPICVLM
jgi:hypothetical protein